MSSQIVIQGSKAQFPDSDKSYFLSNFCNKLVQMDMTDFLNSSLRDSLKTWHPNAHVNSLLLPIIIKHTIHLGLSSLYCRPCPCMFMQLKLPSKASLKLTQSSSTHYTVTVYLQGRRWRGEGLERNQRDCIHTHILQI